LRTSDIAGRSGGEEFLLLLPATDMEGARTVAEGLRAAIAELRVPGVDQPITMSIGLAVLPLHAIDAEGLLRGADRALYRAKANGRNRVEAAGALDPSALSPAIPDDSAADLLTAVPTPTPDP
jgi:diguanylate cyclase (GGDEF)-like protein